MEFVTCDAEGKYKVNAQASQFLQSQTCKISVVGVAGSHRMGKSTLLNRLLGSSAFATSSSTQSQTKGLWLAQWKPGILLMDAEGLGSTDADDAHDFNIFCLVVLLSSAFIYNNIGAITTTAMQSLRLAGKLSQYLKNSAKIKISDTTLVWLARDFNLDLKDANNNAIDAQSYLEQQIATNKGLLELFPRRTCFTLPRPAQNDRDVAAMTRIVPEFTEGIQNLQEHLLRTAKPKQCAGMEITGPALLVLAKTIVDCLNDGKMLDFVPVYDGLVQIKDMEARQLAKQAIGFADPLETVVKVMNIYESNRIEPQSTQVLQEMVQLIHSAHETYLDKFLASDMALDNLPPNLRRFLVPYVDKHSKLLAQLKQQSDETIRKLQTALDALQIQFKDHTASAESQIASLEANCAKSKESVSSLEKEILQWQAKYSCSDTEMAQLTEEMEEMRSLLTTTTSQNLQCTNRLQHTEAQLAIATENSEHMKTTITNEMKDVRACMAKLKTDLELCQTQKKEQEQCLQEQQDINAKQLGELEAQNARVAKLEQEHNQMQQQMQHDKTTLRNLEAQLTIAKAREEEFEKHRKRQRTQQTDSVAQTEVEWLKKRYAQDQQTLESNAAKIAYLERETMRLGLLALKQ